MAKVHDLLANIAENGGEYGDTFADDLMTAYDDDMSVVNAAVGERDATIETLHGQIAEHDAIVNALKAANYDLLTNNTSPGDTDDTGVVSDEAPFTGTVDDMFTDERNDN